MIDMIILANDENFHDSVLEKSKEIPVIVEFYADWCGACRMLAPIMENIAKKYKNKIIVAVANIDDNPTSSNLYDVEGIPSVKFIKNKKVIDSFVGFMTEEKIIEWVEKNV